MSAHLDFVREAFRTKERGVDWRSGLAGALASVGPLAIGLAVDEPVAGITAALGGMNVALCVPHADVKARLWWGSVAVLGQVAAVVAAGAARNDDARLVVLTVGWVMVWAFFRAAGPAGALVGFANSAVFVIFAGLPTTLSLGEQVALFVLGAVLGLALMVVARSRPALSIPFGSAALRKVGSALRGDVGLRAHAGRLSVAVGGGSLFYSLAGLSHGYWVPLTTLAVLQPTQHGTRLRSLQRVAGTLVAAGLIVVVLLATDDRWWLVVCSSITAFLLFALDERGYFWLVVLLTPTVLLMISCVDDDGDKVVLDRVAQTVIGVVIGFAIAETVNEVARIRDAHRARRRPIEVPIPCTPDDLTDPGDAV